MSSDVSYPSFKCILEYLEANKRIHICARSKAFQKIDKKIPLHIEYLIFTEQYIYVNDTRIELISDNNLDNAQEKVYVDGDFRHWNQVVMPGDVRMHGDEFYELSNTENLTIRNQKAVELKFFRYNNEKKRLSPNIPQSVAMKTAATVLFGGRSSIHVTEISVSGSILRLPVGFNIRIRNTLNIGCYNIDDIPRVIDPQSFPLKTIVSYPTTPENFYKPVVQTAETLVIVLNRIIQDPWRREILTLPYKHMDMLMIGFDYEELISVVQDWLNHPREHGSIFTMR